MAGPNQAMRDYAEAAGETTWLVAELISMETLMFIANSPDPDAALRRVTYPFSVPEEVPGTDEAYKRELADLNRKYGRGEPALEPSAEDEK